MPRYNYDGPRTSAKVTRRFETPPERIFDAWTDPEIACKWLFTNISSTTTYELDVREGGPYTITRVANRKAYVAAGKYLEIDRPRRLVFTFGMPQFAADFDTVIVELEPNGDGSLLTVTQEGLRPGYETSTLNGWGRLLMVWRRFSTHCQTTSRREPGDGEL
jgi:uncharacterized protein YndB with AHSA1/START domain